jgi:hypothetical protein
MTYPDVVQFMKAQDRRTVEVCPEMEYDDDEADEAAIANLERLQKERPLRPPGQK